MRPRSSIKPPARYDEVYIISEGDATQKAMMKELDSWKAHDVYKEVDRSEANNNIITTIYHQGYNVNEKTGKICGI